MKYTGRWALDRALAADRPPSCARPASIDLFLSAASEVSLDQYCLLLRGTVANYYIKQTAQEIAVRAAIAADVWKRIVVWNELEVMEGGNANSHRWFDENIEAMATDTQHRFSLRETRAIVQDLFEPKPAIYWFDFLASMLVGGVCFTAARQINLLPVRCLLGLAACLAYYRAALFTHELVHLRTNSMRAFRVAWNLFCGIPFLMPSFLYYTHRDHHVRKHYGTPNDGEYLPFTTSPRIELLKYFLQPLFFPLLFVMRFLVLTPLTWFSPRLRRWVQRKFSSMVIDPDYVRPSPTRAELKVWRLQEAACFLYSLAAAWLFMVHHGVSGSILRG